MAMTIGGLAVFVLLVAGVVGYAIRFRPPKVERAPSETDLRRREWTKARAELPVGVRWTLFWTNCRGAAAPVELAPLGALRAEAMLIRLGSIDGRSLGRRRYVDAGFSIYLALFFALIGYSRHSWWSVVVPLVYAGLAIRTLRAPARLSRDRRRLARALFANQAVIDHQSHGGDHFAATRTTNA